MSKTHTFTIWSVQFPGVTLLTLIARGSPNRFVKSVCHKLSPFVMNCKLARVDSVPVLVVCSPSPNLTDGGASHCQAHGWVNGICRWLCTCTNSGYQTLFLSLSQAREWGYIGHILWNIQYPQTNSETASGIEQEARYPPPYLLSIATRGDKPVAMVMFRVCMAKGWLVVQWTRKQEKLGT